MATIAELIDDVDRNYSEDNKDEVDVIGVYNELKELKKKIAYSEINDVWIKNLASAMRESVN